MKRVFSTIVLLVVLIGGGYFVYNEYFKSNQPEEVAVNTGTIDVNEIPEDEYNKLDEDTQQLIKKYNYNETFDSFDTLDKEMQDDGSYVIPKYDNQKLYLILASKQKDNSIIAIFDDKE